MPGRVIVATPAEGAARPRSAALRRGAVWQATIEGKYLVSRRPGKVKKTKPKGEWSARVEIQKQLLARLDNWLLVRLGRAPKQAAVAAVNKREAQIAKDADVLDIYADWLQEQGDVRGELAALQATTRSSR